MNLRSDNFVDQGKIPSKFTCDGKDISPHLEWEDQPDETSSFALSLRDPDAPGEGFIHWLVYGIPSNIRSIPKGEDPKGIQLNNDFNNRGYGGPCPPTGTHRYIFTLYALDVERLEDITKENFFRKVQQHSIAESKLVGLYSRN